MKQIDFILVSFSLLGLLSTVECAYWRKVSYTSIDVRADVLRRWIGCLIGSGGARERCRAASNQEPSKLNDSILH